MKWFLTMMIGSGVGFVAEVNSAVDKLNEPQKCVVEVEPASDRGTVYKITGPVICNEGLK